MGIDVKDLPPAYQAQALQKYMEAERRKKRTPLPCPADGAPGGGQKYHNKPTERVTASGKVMDFTLQEAYTDSEGNRVRAIRYRADFSYKKRPTYWTGYEQQCPDDGWILVVEDVKSRATRTKEYVMKRKLMKERLNIDIQEV